ICAVGLAAVNVTSICPSNNPPAGEISSCEGPCGSDVTSGLEVSVPSDPSLVALESVGGVSLGKPPVEGVPSEDDEPAVGFGSRPGVALVPGVCGPPVGLLGDVVSPPGNPEGGG